MAIARSSFCRGACEERPDYAPLAAKEDDFASIRDDPRFPVAESL